MSGSFCGSTTSQNRLLICVTTSWMRQPAHPEAACHCSAVSWSQISSSDARSALTASIASYIANLRVIALLRDIVTLCQRVSMCEPWLSALHSGDDRTSSLAPGRAGGTDPGRAGACRPSAVWRQWLRRNVSRGHSSARTRDDGSALPPLPDQGCGV